MKFGEMEKETLCESLPPHGGSGLKYLISAGVAKIQLSPSTRREWIEMALSTPARRTERSPSTRREWIEIALCVNGFCIIDTSPSTRREWIEIAHGVR